MIMKEEILHTKKAFSICTIGVYDFGQVEG